MRARTSLAAPTALGWFVWALMATLGGGLEAAAQQPSPGPDAADSEGPDGQPAKEYTTESLRGQVVWMDEALREKFGIESDSDATHSLVAIATSDGRLHPIVKDFRGRAFHSDPRLHNMDLELLVRRYEGSPMVQVVRVYSWKEEQKYELDYWCDICAIPMYELKECECCQGPIRIRERPVDDEPSSE